MAIEERRDSSRIGVLIDGGAPFFSVRLAKMLRDAGIEVQLNPTLRKHPDALIWLFKTLVSKQPIVHSIHGQCSPWFYLPSKVVAKKVVVHWTGSDVIRAMACNRSATRRLLRKLTFRMIDMHLAVSEPLAQELRSMAVEAAVVPLVPFLPPSEQANAEWPSGQMVYVYLPEDRPQLYCAAEVFSLARELQQIKFLITGHSGRNAPQLPNIQYLGWIDDMDAVWRQVRVYLRLVQHDGMPQCVLEALARGKYVVWTYAFPHCFRAGSHEETRDALLETSDQTQPNSEAAAWVRLEYDPARLVRTLKQAYSNLLSREKG